MFDVLVYLYENYWRPDACPDHAQLMRKLSAVGFESDEIQEALSWLDLAATCAEPGAESDAVNQRAADLLSLAGWSEAPATCRRHAPAQGELEPGDLDLRVTSHE